MKFVNIDGEYKKVYLTALDDSYIYTDYFLDYKRPDAYIFKKHYIDYLKDVLEDIDSSFNEEHELKEVYSPLFQNTNKDVVTYNENLVETKTVNNYDFFVLIDLVVFGVFSILGDMSLEGSEKVFHE